MKILAVDTSGRSASLALLEDENLLGEVFFDLGVHHSEIILPALDQLCKTTGSGVREVDLFVCTNGPGSFTGLRIGLSTVKGLALATGKPVVGVSTLESLAWNASASPLALCPMLDARKNQVYAALYRKEPAGSMQNLLPDRIADLEVFLEKITERTLFLGDGALRYRGEIEARLSAGASFGAFASNQVRAGFVGLLGWQKFKAGAAGDAITAIPRYLRLSEAEEKRGA